MQVTGSGIEEIIQNQLSTWDDYRNLPEESLLHLELLRRLFQILHAEKSRCLAKGYKAEAQIIHQIEAELEKIRAEAKLHPRIPNLLKEINLSPRRFAPPPKKSGPPVKGRSLPESFLNSLEKKGIGRDRFLRLDRADTCLGVGRAPGVSTRIGSRVPPCPARDRTRHTTAEARSSI